MTSHADQLRFLHRDLALQLDWLRDAMAKGSLLPTDLAAMKVAIDDIASLRGRINRLRSAREQEGVKR
jgi:hypothetical protein